MNNHKNARLTAHGRYLLVQRIAQQGLKSAAHSLGVSGTTALKWRRRFAQYGMAGLVDGSSRPARTRSRIDSELSRRIEQLRRTRMPMRRIAATVGRSVASISRHLRGLGLSGLRVLDPVQAVLRYEHPAPGELLHMDTKKLGRIERVGHRINGDRTTRSRGAGWEYAHLAIDDHSRLGFVQMHEGARGRTQRSRSCERLCRITRRLA